MLIDHTTYSLKINFNKPFLKTSKKIVKDFTLSIWKTQLDSRTRVDNVLSICRDQDKEIIVLIFVCFTA